MDILQTEFDAEHFHSTNDCNEWLAKSDFPNVLRLKNFKLTKKSSPDFSYEVRKVWRFSEPMWKYTQLQIVRPTPFVKIVIQGHADVFTTENVPGPLPDTVQKLRKIKIKTEEKKLADEKKREKRRQARKEEDAASGGKKKPKGKGKRKAEDAAEPTESKKKSRSKHLFQSKRPKKPVEQADPVKETSDSDDDDKLKENDLGALASVVSKEKEKEKESSGKSSVSEVTEL